MHSRFAIWFFVYFLLINIVLSRMFVAIMVHSYFEVDLLRPWDSKDPQRWTQDQWLQWALWDPVYKWKHRMFQSEPGCQSLHPPGGEQDEDEFEGEDIDSP